MSEYQNLPSNSDASRRAAQEDTYNVEPVAKGEKIVEKPGLLKRLTKMFIAVGPREMFDRLVEYVLVPSAKNMLSDAITNAKDIMLFGSGSGTTSNSVLSSDNPEKYHDVGNKSQSLSVGDRESHNFANVRYTSKEKAERVKSLLLERLDAYDEVTVAYFYSISDIDPESEDFNYGWKSLSSVYARQIPPEGKWILVLPPVKRLST